jgi:protein TonB
MTRPLARTPPPPGDGRDPTRPVRSPGAVEAPPPSGPVGRRARWRWVAPFALVCAAHFVAVWSLSQTLARVEPVFVPPVVGLLVTPEVEPPKELPVAPPAPAPPAPPAPTPPTPPTPPPVEPLPEPRVERAPKPRAERAPPRPRAPRPKPAPVVVAEPSDRAPEAPEPSPPAAAQPPMPAPIAPAPPAPSSVEAAPPQPPAAPPPPPPPVTPPRADAAHLSNPAPVYPALSRRLGEQGRVLFDVHILADGSVGEIRLKRSSGHPRLDQSALEAVRNWRYLPARRGGEPIPFWYVQPIEFSLAS